MRPTPLRQVADDDDAGKDGIVVFAGEEVEWSSGEWVGWTMG